MAVTRHAPSALQLRSEAGGSTTLSSKAVRTGKTLRERSSSSVYSHRLYSTTARGYVFLLAVCLVLGALSHAHSAWRGVGTLGAAAAEYPYSYASLNMAVAPHHSSSDSSIGEGARTQPKSPAALFGESDDEDTDEREMRPTTGTQLESIPREPSERGTAESDEEMGLSSSGYQGPQQRDVMDKAEEEDEEDLSSLQPLEGSWGGAPSRDMLEDDMFLGADEDLGTEGATDLEGAFVELEYPGMHTASSKCRPPCRRQTDDMVDALDDDADGASLNMAAASHHSSPADSTGEGARSQPKSPAALFGDSEDTDEKAMSPTTGNQLESSSREPRERGNVESDEEMGHSSSGYQGPRQRDVMDRAEGEDEEDSSSLQPLEGSWGGAQSRDMLEDDMFLGADEDLETEGTSDLEGAFIELEYPGMHTASNKCRPPCRRQTTDILDALDDDAEDDDDDEAVSGVTDDADEEEELLSAALDTDETVGETSFMHQDDRARPGVIDENDGIWNTDSPTGGDMLPVEYTLEKYRDTTSSVRKTEDAGPTASPQAISQMDTSMDKHNAMPLSTSQEKAESPTSQMHSPSGLPSAPPSALQAGTTQAPPPPPPTEEAPAAGMEESGTPPQPSKGESSESRRELAANDEVATSGNAKTAGESRSKKAQPRPMDAEESEAEAGEGPAPMDAEGLEAEDTDVFEEGQDLTGEFGLAEMKSQKAPSLSSEEPRKLEARYNVGTTEGKTSSAAELEAATVVLEQGSGLNGKDKTTNATKEGVLGERVGEEKVVRTRPGMQTAFVAQRHSEHQKQLEPIPVNSLLHPPSFIDWQTLGAVMTSPALRGSGSPFLAQNPQYFSTVPAEHTSQHGRIIIILCTSMIVLLIILLFCCCMVRRKRAHEAYMAAPMVIR